MFRDLVPLLADKYHVIAPDYPGYMYSHAPPVEQFSYTFDHLTDVIDHLLEQLKVTRCSIYIQDYGSPVGFRQEFPTCLLPRFMGFKRGNEYGLQILRGSLMKSPNAF